MSLDHSTLETLRRQHPAWRLLAAEHVPLVASFLHCTECMGDGPSSFPRRLRLQCHTATELSARFEEVRAWGEGLRLGSGRYRLKQERIGFGWVQQSLSNLRKGKCG